MPKVTIDTPEDFRIANMLDEMVSLAVKNGLPEEMQDELPTKEGILEMVNGVGGDPTQNCLTYVAMGLLLLNRVVAKLAQDRINSN